MVIKYGLPIWISNFKNLEYTERLKELDLHTLKYRKFRGDLIQMYKIMNKIDDLKCDKCLCSIQIRHGKKCRTQIVC